MMILARSSLGTDENNRTYKGRYVREIGMNHFRARSVAGFVSSGADGNRRFHIRIEVEAGLDHDVVNDLVLLPLSMELFFSSDHDFDVPISYAYEIILPRDGR